MQSLLAIRGGDIQRDFRDEFSPGDDPADWFDRTEEALAKAIGFLRSQGIPHLALMSYTLQAGNAIAKFPDGRPGHSGIPEAELACLNLAARNGHRRAGPPSELLSSISGLEDWAAKISEPALIVDRFDRLTDDRRVHMEELAQILDIPTARQDVKYLRANFETVASYVGALAGVESVGQVIERIVVNVLAGNGDAHLKNWAVGIQTELHRC